MFKNILTVFVVFCLLTPVALAQTAETTGQRPSFSNNTETTAPGTVEVEFGTFFGEDLFSLPITLKYTPDVENGFFRRGEIGVVFDALTDAPFDTSAANAVGLVYRRPIYDGERTKFAVAPFFVFLRNEEGRRGGFSLIGTHEFGRNTLVGNFVWSRTSDLNAGKTDGPWWPINRYNLVFGVSRLMEDDRTSLAIEILQTNPSRQLSFVSLLQSVGYQLRPNVSLDFFVQENGITAGSLDFEVGFGATVNVGNPRNWF